MRLSRLFRFLFLFVALILAFASRANESKFFDGVWSAHEGTYSVHMSKVDFSYDCSWVLADLRYSEVELQIETLFDCEDGETQMIPNMYFQIHGDEIWWENQRVGSYGLNDIQIKIPVRENGYESYVMRRVGNILEFSHSYSLNGIEYGTLKSQLKNTFLQY